MTSPSDRPTIPLDRVRAALAGRYDVQRELGAGGMATVYLADDVRHGRRVAVKVLRPDLAQALGPERFLREIRTAAALHHPHILSLHDSGEADGLLYYVMPFVEGESLRDRLRRERQLPVHEALRIAREVADALEHAHRRGVVHRDIKPENILLEDGHATVADFGIARAVGDADTTQLTGTGLAIGTPAYMSPEQALADGELDARSDIYAVGCVLYEMLAGEPPFAGRTAQASITRRLTEPAPLIRHVRDTVPAAIEGAIAMALARLPADRFGSAAEFRHALGDVARVDTAALAARPRRWRLSRRTAQLAAVVATVAVGAAAVFLRSAARSETAALPAGAAGPPGVAVLPFRTAGSETEFWHEGIVELLSYNVDGVPGLRRIDPVTVITEWRRQGGTASEALSEAESREVGRRVGGRYVVTGGVIEVGSDVQVIAEVYDVERGMRRGAVRVLRPADSVSAIVDELAMELLRQNLLPTDGEYPPPDLSQVTTSSVAALKAYLAGEREYRMARFGEAARRYEEAIALDPKFARAIYRLARAYGWQGSSRGEEYGARALAMAAQLPERDAMLMRAYASEDITALEEVTARYPDYVEGWATLGDTYFHVGGKHLRPADAYRGAFRRALELHPYYGEAFVHLIEDAFLRRDSAEAARLIDAYIALGGEEASCSYRVPYALVWGPAPAFAWAMGVLDTLSAAALFDCVQAPLEAPPRALDRMAQLYEAAADTMDSGVWRTVAVWRLLQVRMPHGQVAEARRALGRLERVHGLTIRYARWLVMIHLSGYPDSAGVGRAVARLAVDPEPTDHFWTGSLAIAEERSDDAARTADVLDRQAAGFGRERETEAKAARGYAAALRAYAAMVEGDLTRLDEFESALARLPAFGWDHEQPHQYLRYQVGRLLLERGRLRDAERYFVTFQPYEHFYASQAELQLGRITEALGRDDEAAVHYGEFVRWWRYADPPLRGQLEGARAALARLAAEPGEGS